MPVRLSLVALILSAVTVARTAQEPKLARGRHKYPDPFSLLDRHLSQALSSDHVLVPQLSAPYFWPWAELAKAAVALDDEDALEEPSVQADPDKYEIKLDVRRFKPHELKVRVKDRAVLVEGKRVITDEQTEKRYVANHFVQRYTLPPGVEPDEVTAVLKANGVLVVTAPRRSAPTPPERHVPLVVEEASLKKDSAKEDAPPVVTAKPEEEENKKSNESKPNNKLVTENEDQPSEQKRLKQHMLQKKSSEETSSSKEDLSTESTPDVVAETTTAVSKIKKKELKNAVKDPKRNETKKASEKNELDYAVDVNSE